ncbi:MAG: hypothetical protein JWO31_2868, partial [Phycisphaerales bacterium]|nr:hypothetical protein [Phycisphaerales bacterium]
MNTVRRRFASAVLVASPAVLALLSAGRPAAGQVPVSAVAAAVGHAAPAAPAVPVGQATPAKPATSAAAATDAGPAQGATPASGSANPVIGLDAVLPDVQFERVGVADAVQFLQDSVPSFKAVVVGEGGGPADDLPVTLRLRNTTVGQVLDVIKVATGDAVSVEMVAGPTGPVHVIRVRRAAAGAAAARPGGPAVQVYRLSGIVSRMVGARSDEDRHRDNGLFRAAAAPAADDAAAIKAGPNGPAELAKRRTAALNNVLSVVQATLQLAAGGPNAPTVQLHEETQTLIFKGTDAQRAALEDLLASLEGDRAIRV